MTAHVLSSTFVRQKFCIDCGPITAAHTADNIRNQFEKVIVTWPGMKRKLYCVVRDGASSVKKVCVFLNKLLHTIDDFHFRHSKMASTRRCGAVHIYSICASKTRSTHSSIWPTPYPTCAQSPNCSPNRRRPSWRSRKRRRMTASSRCRLCA